MKKTTITAVVIRPEMTTDASGKSSRAEPTRYASPQVYTDQSIPPSADQGRNPVRHVGEAERGVDDETQPRDVPARQQQHRRAAIEEIQCSLDLRVCLRAIELGLDKRPTPPSDEEQSGVTNDRAEPAGEHD